MKKITAIALGEEVGQKKYKTRNVSVNTTKQVSNSQKRPSNFIFNPPSGHFIFIAGKGDWEYYFSEGGGNNITCKGVRKPSLMYLWNKGTFGFSGITLLLCLAEVVIKAFRST